MKGQGLILLILSALLMTPGCYESPDVVIHKPGIYKGGKDPLLERLRSADHQEMLRNRVILIQSDR